MGHSGTFWGTLCPASYSPLSKNTLHIYRARCAPGLPIAQHFETDERFSSAGVEQNFFWFEDFARCARYTK
jgi:hypothetical protein